MAKSDYIRRDWHSQAVGIGIAVERYKTTAVDGTAVFVRIRMSQQ